MRCSKSPGLREFGRVRFPLSFLPLASVFVLDVCPGSGGTTSGGTGDGFPRLACFGGCCSLGGFPDLIGGRLVGSSFAASLLSWVVSGLSRQCFPAIPPWGVATFLWWIPLLVSSSCFHRVPWAFLVGGPSAGLEGLHSSLGVSLRFGFSLGVSLRFGFSSLLWRMTAVCRGAE
jgi:hypothetical protein